MAFLRDEKVINVEASYYYLRRNGDKVEDIREDDFFDNKSKNVLTLSDVYYTADPNRKTEVDANFKKEFLEFFQSQECDPESCEHCTLNKKSKRCCYLDPNISKKRASCCNHCRL